MAKNKNTTPGPGSLPGEGGGPTSTAEQPGTTSAPPREPWPSEENVGEDTDKKTPLEEANDAILCIKLAILGIRADVDRVLRGPRAGELRKAAALEMCQIGGDSRHWNPLNLLDKVIERLKPENS